jgi:hypothetical protein
LLPRHKGRASSGLVEPSISLVKSPITNRYAVFSLRAGETYPHVLPALEIDLASGRLFFHGSGPEDPKVLITKINSFLEHKPDASGQIGEISLRQLEEFAANIAQDSDFNPRIYLSARGQLEICARNPEEGLSAIRAVAYLVSTKVLASYESSGWQTWQMPSNIPHTVVFEHDATLFDRVIAKIACGLLGAWLRVNTSSALNLPTAQAFVRGDIEAPPGMVTQLSGQRHVDPRFPAQLICAVRVGTGSVIGLVGLYEEWHVLNLGVSPSPQGLPETIGAVCQLSPNRGQGWLSAEEADGLIHAYEQGDYGSPLVSGMNSQAMSEE